MAVWRDSRSARPVAIAGRIAAVLGLLGLAGFHMLFALGAGSLMAPGCDDPFGTCVAIGFQAALAFVAAVTFGIAAYRVGAALPTAGIVFRGTLPFWLFHIPVKILDPNEGAFFVVAPAFAPLLAGGVWLLRRQRASGLGSPTSGRPGPGE
jgi:hypothetical protein